MEKTLLVACIALLMLTPVGSGCSREGGQPGAKATAAPAAVAKDAPAARAAAPANEEEELYVDLEAEPDEGPPPLKVKFTSTVEDGTPPFTYKWEFGDGSAASTEANPTHVYQKEGDFTATLTVRDSKGQEGSEEVDVFVELE